MLQLIEVISFSYPNLQDIRLSNVDMGIDMGTCVAIVGPNDTGKSPLPNLLAESPGHVYFSLHVSKPHISDEPTDHLDTQSIVAVAVTLDEFAGRVVLLSTPEAEPPTISTTILILIHSTKSRNSPYTLDKRGTPLPDKNKFIVLILVLWRSYTHSKSTKNNWRCLLGSHKKPPHGAKLVSTCACATTTPDVPADNTFLGHDGLEDHISNERDDSIRRALRLNKGKFVKQSTGIHPDEEPVTYKQFEDLAHAILRVVGSRVPELAASSVIQDVPPLRSDKQIIPRSEIRESSRPKHGPSGTCSKFQTGSSRKERSIASCYSRSSQDIASSKLTFIKQGESESLAEYETRFHQESLEQIFYHIRETDILRPPKPIRKYLNLKRSLKYCEFHKDFGHSTAKCFHLREEIKSLILSEYLKEFVVDMCEARKFLEEDKARGPTLIGEFRRAIKHYNKSLIMDRPKKDTEGISYPYDDALVITLKVATSKVARTLQKKVEPVEVDVVAPGAPEVSHSHTLGSVKDVEVPLDSRVPKEEKRETPTEDVMSVSIYNNDPTKMVKIGSYLPDQYQKQLIDLLKENLDVFTWSHVVMSGIPPFTFYHKLDVNPHHKPVKQKRRTFNEERYDTIEQEVDRLLAAIFIRKAVYPDWVSNVVPVTKSNGK
ncbi:hypothetical protein KPL71_027115 [Citrus sinensis]|uniref:Uncharacterized protein n=1 Tax=Citrus sinensis TaxID=2711 RepID=A0ACB8I491_CITSI|nr:hypothetical protein KPL71_027115 [Citrus sinensis]